MKIKENFGNRRVSILLSNEHIIYGKIVDEDDHSLLIQSPRILLSNGKIKSASFLILMKSESVNVEDADWSDMLNVAGERLWSRLSMTLFSTFYIAAAISLLTFMVLYAILFGHW